MKVWFIAAGVAAALGVAASTAPVLGHGSVTPQAFDTPGLPDLGNTWKVTNPFRDKDKDKAIEIGAHGYLANCAACHGLEMESGGMAPDLHQLPTGAEGDDLYKDKVINGVTRNGSIKMEKYFGTVSQTGLWAIRTYIESKPPGLKRARYRESLPDKIKVALCLSGRDFFVPGQISFQSPVL